MVLHCWGCGAEQNLAQSQPSSVGPVPSAYMQWAEPGWQRSPLAAPITPSHGAQPGVIQGVQPGAEGDAAREGAEDPHSYGIAGTRSHSLRWGWNRAPGSWAGLDRSWAGPVNAFRVLTASFTEKYLKDFYKVIHVRILPQKTQAWTNHPWTYLPWWMWGLI